MYSLLIIVIIILIFLSFICFWKEFLRKSLKNLAWMLFMTFPCWMMFENVLKGIVSVFININYLKHDYEWWDLSSKDTALLGTSISLIMLLLCFLILIVVLSIRKLYKRQKLNFLFESLNHKNFIYIILYYTHFFVIRFTLSVQIFLNPMLERKSWSLIFTLIVQTASVLVHFNVIYLRVSDRLLSFMREIIILFVVIYLLLLDYVDQSTEEHK